jgi:hypothetical protein
MTINAANNNPRIEYTVGQGVEQKVFAIPFEFFEDPEVKLYVDGVLKTQGSGDGKYTVTGGEGSTGTATFNDVSSGTQPVTGISGGSTVIIVRDIPIERVTDFSAGADINRAALNTQLDTLTALVSDADTNILRTLTAPVTDANIDMSLPDKATRLGKALGFNSSTGNPEAVSFYDSDADVRAAVEAASDSNVFTDADHSKLDGIEANATADQTASEIRTLVESATDSNVFTDADHTKLNAIEDNATADQTASEILTAVKTVDGATSGLDADLLDGQHGSYYTGYADTAVSNLVDSAPSTLDTLNELAAALGDDANFSTTVTNSIATKMPLAGGTFTGDVSFGDGDKAVFGAGSDIQIYHDATGSGTSYIDGGGSGNLLIIADDLYVNGSNSENMIKAVEDGAVTLYFNGASKVSTTASGADVVGDITVSGTVDGVDIAARDAILTSTTTTANAAMPVSGGTFTGDVTILDTDDGSGRAPDFNLKRDSASPAAWDYLGAVRFLGEDGASNETPYASVLGRIVDPTSGSEDGRLEIWQQKAGTGTLTYVFDHDAFQLQNEQPIKWKEHHGTAYDVFLEPATPTATRTITLPDATGTVLLSDGDGSNLTGVQAASVNVTESSDDNVDYNILFSNTDGSGNVQMTPAQDDGGLTFNPSTNVLAAAQLQVQSYVYHAGDTDTWVLFETDSVKLGAGGTTPLKVTTGKTTFDGAIEEEVYTLSGTALDPNNGTIQTKTLSANTTLTDSLSAGESITLMIDDGSSYTITWPTITWVNNGGSAPTLATSGYTVIAIWKVSTTLYGALVGDGS